MFTATILFLLFLFSWPVVFYLGRLYLTSARYKKWAEEHAERIEYKKQRKNNAAFTPQTAEYYAAYTARQESLRKSNPPVHHVHELKPWSDFDGAGECQP